METVTDFIFLGSKITADGDCSHKIKRCLLLRRKVMTNLDSILKSRDITLLTKVCLVKAMVFPVVMYECESLTLKKAEYQRIDAFELWCWRRLLRVPWTARRSNQSILKEISPEYSLEGLMLKLKLQYFGHLTHWKRPWCWERLKAGWEGDDIGWDVWMQSPTRWTWVWINSRSWWWIGRPDMLQSMGWQRVGHNWATELNWFHSCQGEQRSSNPHTFPVLLGFPQPQAWFSTVAKSLKRTLAGFTFTCPLPHGTSRQPGAQSVSEPQKKGSGDYPTTCPVPPDLSRHRPHSGSVVLTPYHNLPSSPRSSTLAIIPQRGSEVFSPSPAQCYPVLHGGLEPKEGSAGFPQVSRASVSSTLANAISCLFQMFLIVIQYFYRLYSFLPCNLL